MIYRALILQTKPNSRYIKDSPGRYIYSKSLEFNSWRQRIWTIQKIILLPQATIAFGSLTSPWFVFGDASQRCFEHIVNCCHQIFSFVILPSSLLMIKIKAVHISRTALHRSPFSATITSLDSFQHFRFRNATDART